MDTISIILLFITASSILSCILCDFIRNETVVTTIFIYMFICVFIFVILFIYNHTSFSDGFHGDLMQDLKYLLKEVICDFSICLAFIAIKRNFQKLTFKETLVDIFTLKDFKK